MLQSRGKTLKMFAGYHKGIREVQARERSIGVDLWEEMAINGPFSYTTRHFATASFGQEVSFLAQGWQQPTLSSFYPAKVCNVRAYLQCFAA